MRSKASFFGIAVAVALLPGTLAWSAPLPARRAAATESHVEARPSVTVQRLMSARIDWALRLARAARLLEAPPAEPSKFDTQTIIDEPDPTSAAPRERPDYWPKAQDRGEEKRPDQGLPLPAQPLQ